MDENEGGGRKNREKEKKEGWLMQQKLPTAPIHVNYCDNWVGWVGEEKVRVK